MATTKSERAALLSILRHLERAHTFLQEKTVAVCRYKAAATTTDDYENECVGNALCTIDKDIGSDLTGLYEGIRLLRAFLER
jgi:hypothetical protein